MSEQQRMAAVETDKELSDLLDFSAVSQREISRGGTGAAGGGNATQVWWWAGQ